MLTVGIEKKKKQTSRLVSAMISMETTFFHNSGDWRWSMFTKGEVPTAGANVENSGSNVEISVGLMLSLMEKRGAHSEML